MFGKTETVNRTVLVTLIFLNSLLFGCFYKQKADQNLRIILYKAPNLLATKDSITLYEISNDTLYSKTNMSYWSKSKLKYSLLNKVEKEKIKLLLSNILKTEIIPKYSSNNHDIPYVYEIKAFNKSKLKLFSLINSNDYPDSLDSIFNYVEEISTSKKFFSLEVYHPQVKIRKIVSNLDTINLSNTDCYLIWKNLNTTKNQNITDNHRQATYTILYDYWMDYQGKKISNLTTDNLQDFYYELGGKTYSFQLEKPLQLKGITSIVHK